LLVSLSPVCHNALVLRRSVIGWLLWLGASLAAAGAERVVIKGSNTFGEFLGPQLIAAFRQARPDIEFELERRGTASGIAALIAGECDLGAASRPITPEEWRLARSRGLRLEAHAVGYYGVAVIVHAANPVESLSDVQIRDLFTGQARDWSAVAGAAGPVRLFIRDPVSGTHRGFQELAMAGQPYAEGATWLRSDDEIAAAVAADRHAVGYVGMHLRQACGVRPVAVNGVPPNSVAVHEGLYPYARLILLYSNPARVTRATRQFLRFVQSRRGQQVVEQHGYVPVWGRRLTPLPGNFQ
jgi:phosphate transport system substrate-binding protein